MNTPQIVIQKAHITITTPFDVAALKPLTMLSVADQVDAFLNPDPNRFEHNFETGVITDPLTGLMWAEETEKLEWDSAVKACADCRLGGFTDWRMPTRLELLTILDLDRCKPCLPPVFETAGEYLWTATETPWSKKEGRTGSARSFFFVGLNYGLVSSDLASYRFRARPVRRAAPASQ
ncbi:DUF1566 domain-containing protein [Dyella sp. 2RAB6]|uniref:Lcl C-terminal domain-containing protein n=1 Tax=Dyella sp. 2RAB6 TaxID=3232992 RepID=UPI003F930C16